jgi:hypothetical protein
MLNILLPQHTAYTQCGQLTGEQLYEMLRRASVELGYQRLASFFPKHTQCRPGLPLWLELEERDRQLYERVAMKLKG